MNRNISEQTSSSKKNLIKVTDIEKTKTTYFFILKFTHGFAIIKHIHVVNEIEWVSEDVIVRIY